MRLVLFDLDGFFVSEPIKAMKRSATSHATTIE